MNCQKRVLAFIGAFCSLIAQANAKHINEFEGCADTLLLQKGGIAMPDEYSSLSREELELKSDALFNKFFEFSNSRNYARKKILLQDMRVLIQILHENDYLDSDIIILAGEIDSVICAENKQ